MMFCISKAHGCYRVTAVPLKTQWDDKIMTTMTHCVLFGLKRTLVMFFLFKN